MDSLLADLAVQDEIKINFSRSRHGTKQRSGYTKQFNAGKVKSQQEKSNQRNGQKSCLFCKGAGRNPSSHNTSECWYISQMEKLELSKALQVETCNIDDAEEEELAYVVDAYPESNTQVKASDVQNEAFCS